MQRLFRSAALCIAGCGRTQAPPEHTGRLRGSIAAEATGDGSVAKFRILVRMMDVITVAHLADSNATITAMSWSDDVCSEALPDDSLSEMQVLARIRLLQVGAWGTPIFPRCHP